MNIIINRKRNLFLKRFIAFIISLGLVISCSAVVSAKQITGTSNDLYRKTLEETYGYKLIIDDILLKKDGFYTQPVSVKDVELKVLKDIDSAFSMLPDGFVKEVNDYFKKRGDTPKIDIYYGQFADYPDSIGMFSASEMSIYVANSGNELIDTLLHELGHQVACYLWYKNKFNEVEKYFISQNKNSAYQYNQNYSRLYNRTLDYRFYDYYIREYASSSFDEDFAELFAKGVMQYRYLSSYGNGNVKPIHNKIKKMSEVLCGELKSLENSQFLLNALPDKPAKWAEAPINKAKEKEIIQWKTYGLYNAELTKYDAALILQPFLYKYIDENALLKKAGIKKDEVIPENFVYDIIDGENVWLLHHLKILEVEKGRFNPSQKIQIELAAAILTRVAQLFGLSDNDSSDSVLDKCSDASKISEWAKPYVKFALALKIIDVDDKHNINPKKHMTYQEFYVALLKISDLKEKYNELNKAKLPETAYFQDLNGIAVSSDGWICYYTFWGFTGKAKYKYVFDDGSYFIYIGEWIDGDFSYGRLTWDDGSYLEGEWKDDYLWNGKYVSDLVEVEYVNGEVKTP